jgi:hypothetical protein
MAISLASGVLVSTVLTLVVIPLGCVAASKDLCEVAVATAPSGSNVPCSTAEAEKQPKAEKKPKGGRLIAAWGFVVEGITMAFYLIRGIFLLLFDFVRSLFKKKKTRPAKPPPPRGTTTGTGGGGSTGSGASTPAAPVSGAASAPAARAVAQSTRQEMAVSGSEAERDQPEAPAASRSGASQAAESASEADPGEKALDAPTRALAPTSAPGGEPAMQTDGSPLSAEPESADQGGLASGRGAAGADSTKGSRAKKPAAKKPAAKKRVVKKEADTSSKAKAALTQKRASRRGIRLKVDDGQGPSFD